MILDCILRLFLSCFQIKSISSEKTNIKMKIKLKMKSDRFIALERKKNLNVE